MSRHIGVVASNKKVLIFSGRASRMNVIKKSVKKIVRKLAHKVRVIKVKPIPQGLSPAEFEKEVSRYQKNRIYDDIVERFKFRKFLSASKLILTIDVYSFSLKQQLFFVKCLYSSSYGVQGDIILESLCGKVLTPECRDFKLILALIERVCISGFNMQRKRELISAAKSRMDMDVEEQVDIYYSLQWLSYQMEESLDSRVDPLGYIDWLHVERFGIKIIEKFIPSIKAYGHLDLVKKLVNGFCDGYKNNSEKCFKLLVACWPEKLLEEKQLAASLNFESVDLLPALYLARRVSDDYGKIYQSALKYSVESFARLNSIQQDAFLRVLVKQEHYKLVLELSAQAEFPITPSPVMVAKAFLYLDGDDYLSARDCFEMVLKEDPSDTSAATGLRFALPRAGRAMSELIDLRDAIGYGTRSAGRAGARDHSGEITVSWLMSGDYIRGQYSKRASKHWVALKKQYRERFLNYERLRDCSAKSLFVIGDEGVGDEIRTAQFYEGLTFYYKDITISCDPRLLRIFSKSFPSIKFVPVRRLRKILNSSVDEGECRLNGYGDKVRNYLDEGCREVLECADRITFGQNIFFNYFLGELNRPAPGAYLSWGCGEDRLGSIEKLRIGILWRSHLRGGARKMMYLDVKDFLPLTQLPGVEVWSVQHDMDDEERRFCDENQIRQINDVDLFDDFEGLSDYLKAMDLLIGVSSVPIELGAAFGTEVWMLGFSPENYYLRTEGGKDSHDRYTLNSTVIAPPWIDFSEPRDECVRQVFSEVCRKLDDKLRSRQA